MLLLARWWRDVLALALGPSDVERASSSCIGHSGKRHNMQQQQQRQRAQVHLLAFAVSRSSLSTPRSEGHQRGSSAVRSAISLSCVCAFVSSTMQQHAGSLALSFVCVSRSLSCMFTRDEKSARLCCVVCGLVLLLCAGTARASEVEVARAHVHQASERRCWCAPHRASCIVHVWHDVSKQRARSTFGWIDLFICTIVTRLMHRVLRHV